MIDLYCYRCNHKITTKVKKCPKCNASVALSIADVYYNGVDLEKDLIKAFKLYNLACLDNDKYAFYNVGFCYYNGFGTEKNYEKAFEYLKKSYEMNEAAATYLYATCYLEGRGVEQDFVKGVQILKKGVSEGNRPDCMLALAMHYEIERDQSIPEEISHQEALKWYELGAKTNDPDCLYFYALIYNEGNIVPIDIDKYIEILKKAAEAGSDLAIESLCEYYEEGIHVIKDKKQASYYYGLQAQTGNIEALVHQKGLQLDLYIEGDLDIDINDIKEVAEECYKEKIKGAAYIIGMLYLYGFIYEKDKQKAQSYLYEGYRSGDKRCIKPLHDIKYNSEV